MFPLDFPETVDTGLAGIYRERYRRQSKRFDTELKRDLTHGPDTRS